MCVSLLGGYNQCGNWTYRMAIRVKTAFECDEIHTQVVAWRSSTSSRSCSIAPFSVLLYVTLRDVTLRFTHTFPPIHHQRRFLRTFCLFLVCKQGANFQARYHPITNRRSLCVPFYSLNTPPPNIDSAPVTCQLVPTLPTRQNKIITNHLFLLRLVTRPSQSFGGSRAFTFRPATPIQTAPPYS